MGIMVYSLLWVMQDLCHQPYTTSHDPNRQTNIQVPKPVLKLMQKPYNTLNRDSRQMTPQFFQGLTTRKQYYHTYDPKVNPKR